MAFIETQWSDSEEPPILLKANLCIGRIRVFLNQNRLRLKDLKEELRKLGFG